MCRFIKTDGCTDYWGNLIIQITDLDTGKIYNAVIPYSDDLMVNFFDVEFPECVHIGRSISLVKDEYIGIYIEFVMVKIQTEFPNGKPYSECN